MSDSSLTNDNLSGEEDVRQGISVKTKIRRRSSVFWFLLLAILGAAAYFRFHGLSEQSLWFDEAFSWRMIELPWTEIARATANDTHPPLYYFLLKTWLGLFGDSLFVLRLLSAILGVATVLGVYLFAVEAYGLFCRDDRYETGDRAHTLAALAAALTAFSPFQIDHARDLRMYPLGSFLALLSSWLLLRALRGSPYPLPTWTGYVISASALAYTHAYGLFTIAAQALFAVGFLVLDAFRRQTSVLRTPQLWRAILALCAVGLIYSPWLPVLILQQEKVAAHFWTQTSVDYGTIAETFEVAFTGVRGLPAASRYSFFLLPAVMAVLLALLLRRKSSDTYIVLLASMPLLLGLAVSVLQGRNVLVSRYLYFSFPFLLIAISRLATTGPDVAVRIGIVLLLVLNFGLQACWSEKEAETRGNAGMQAAATAVMAEWRPGDQVLTLNTDLLFASSYYLRQQARPFMFLRAQDERGLLNCYWFGGNLVNASNDFIDERRIRRWGAARVWLLWSGAEGVKIADLPRNWRLVASAGYPDASDRYFIHVNLYAVDRAQTMAPPGMSVELGWACHR